MSGRPKHVIENARRCDRRRRRELRRTPAFEAAKRLVKQSLEDLKQMRDEVTRKLAAQQTTCGICLEPVLSPIDCRLAVCRHAVHARCYNQMVGASQRTMVQMDAAIAEAVSSPDTPGERVDELLYQLAGVSGLAVNGLECVLCRRSLVTQYAEVTLDRPTSLWCVGNLKDFADMMHKSRTAAELVLAVHHFEKCAAQALDQLKDMIAILDGVYTKHL